MALKRYVRKIEELDQEYTDASQFREALKQKEWVVLAAQDESPDKSVKELAGRLLSLVRDPNAQPVHIRDVAHHFMTVCNESKVQGTTDEGKQTFTVAWWSTVSALVSTFLALLIGEKGLLPFLQQWSAVPLVDPKPGPVVTPPQSEGIIAYLHVGLVCLVMLVQFTDLGTPDKEQFARVDNVIQRVFKQFLRGWFWIWASWLALYSWFSVCWGFTDWYVRHNSTMWVVADGINIFNAVMFFYCFLVLDMPSVKTDEDQDRAKQFHRNLVFISVTGAVLAILTSLGRTGWASGLKYSGPLMAAFYTGLAMAYLFGRLDSHHMRVPRWMLAPLYGYVIIQLTWASFADEHVDPSKRVMFLGAALILKVLLFLLVTNWIRDGSLLTYLQDAEKFYRERVSASALGEVAET